MSRVATAQKLQMAGEIQKAIEIYYELLNENFDDPEVLFGLGTAFMQNGLNGLGAQLISSCMGKGNGPRSDMQVALNLGACYFREFKFDEAREAWALYGKIAHEKGDKMAMGEALFNTASTYILSGEYQEGLAYYDKACELIPDHKEMLFNKGQALLGIGKWKEGWALYDHALALGNRRARGYVGVPEWNGEAGRTVVVYGEQGIGDEIMFASMVPDLKARCARVIFDCHPRLVETFQRSFGITCYGTRKEPAAPWLEHDMPDYAIAVGSLGRFFRNSAADFPGTPYLRPRSLKENVAALRNGSDMDRVGAAKSIFETGWPVNKFKVGLSWAGGTKVTGRHYRSMPIDAFEPLIRAHPEIEFYSLQYGPESAAEVDNFEMRTGLHIRHYPEMVDNVDYGKTIDFVAGLDLVITVCQSVLHVAGALGVPCWVMAPYESMWRETGNVETGRSEKMPWYNSVKLYHRETPHAEIEGWAPVLNRIYDDLENLLNRKQAAE